MSRPQLRTALLAALTLLMPYLTNGPTLAASPERAAPQGQDPPGGDNGAPQTPPPAEHDGVIPPPDIGDEGIHTDVPNPDAGTEEEVIPPPDQPGEKPDVDPR
jgi:hypothetical protein